MPRKDNYRPLRRVLLSALKQGVACCMAIGVLVLIFTLVS